MVRNRSLSPRAKSLKAELQVWIDEHDLAEETIWWPAEEDERTGADLVVTFEGDLHSVLWRQPFEGHNIAVACRLRSEFDAIVKKHSFLFEFKDGVTGHFYEQ